MILLKFKSDLYWEHDFSEPLFRHQARILSCYASLHSSARKPHPEEPLEYELIQLNCCLFKNVHKSKHFEFLFEGFDYSDEDNDFDAGDWDDPPNEHLSVAAYSDDALSITSSDVTRTGTPAVVIYPFEVCSCEVNIYESFKMF